MTPQLSLVVVGLAPWGCYICPLGRLDKPFFTELLEVSSQYTPSDVCRRCTSTPSSRHWCLWVVRGPWHYASSCIYTCEWSIGGSPSSFSSLYWYKIIYLVVHLPLADTPRVCSRWAAPSHKTRQANNCHIPVYYNSNSFYYLYIRTITLCDRDQKGHRPCRCYLASFLYPTVIYGGLCNSYHATHF